jgi:hypothetical protein
MIRTGFIGGSDCVKIMQGNWHELWQIKTGQVESPDLSDNIAVQLGTYTEQFNLEWFEKEHDVRLGNHQLEVEEEMYHTDGSIPIKGTIDAMIKGKNPCIVEAKHTNAFNSMEGIIEYYMPQIQCYLWLMRSSIKYADVSGCYLSVLFGNSKWESAFVSADKEYQNSMWKVVAKFWHHVTSGQEPDHIVPNQAPSHDKIAVDGMVRRDASKENGFVSAAYDYLKFKDEAKLFESSKKDLKAMVKADEREVYSDVISIKRSKNGALRIVETKQ